MKTSWTISTRCAVLTCLILVSAGANAQDGRSFTPEQIQRFREMRERGRGGEGNPDFGRRSRGGEDRGRGAGFDRGGERGGFGRDWRGEGGPPRGRDGGDEGDRNWGRGPGNGDESARGAGPAAPATTRIERKPKPRYTVDLPSLFTEVDSDQDGQVGLYEWKKSKRSVADFTRIDLNGDGFLTPVELVQAGSLPEPGTANIASVQPAAPAGAAVASAGARTPQPTQASPPKVAAASPAAIDVDLASPLAQKAKRLFQLMDTDGDGNVSAAEWSRGTKIRPQFEEAGLDLSQPMSSSQFVSHYVTLNAPKG